MTATQAYQVLNVSPGASQPEIQQAYRAALRALQLKLVTGQPLVVRQKALAQIAELKSAFEFLKNMAGPGVQPAWAGGPTPPQTRPTAIPPGQPTARPPIPPTAIPHGPPVAGFPAQPIGMPPVPPGAGFPAQPPTMMPNPFGPGPVAPTYPWVLPAGFVLAAAVMVLVIVLCLGPTASLDRHKTARLRILSVPWSYVTVDGRLLGPSGQTDAFPLQPGDHEVVLRQEDRVLSYRVHLSENCETVLKAQLEKGQIDVAHKRI
jgi:hypothetical protein